MRNFRLPIAFVLSVAVGSGVLRATVSTGPKPLEDRFTESDLVCVCVVTKIAQTNSTALINGKLPPADYTISATVRRLYKGTSQDPNIRIALRGQDPMSGRPLLLNSSYILFLGVAFHGNYRLVETEGAAEPFSLQGSGSRASSGLGGLEADIRQELIARPSDAAGINLLGLLLQFQKLSPDTLAVLAPLSRGAPSVTALLSLEALCRSARDPAGYVTQLISMLLTYTATASSDLPGLGDNVSRIGDILATKSTRRDLDGLERLTTSPVGALSVCAMLGIRNLRDPDEIPFLISKLDASDRLIQYEAIITLSEIIGKNGDYGPGMGLFGRDPAKYVALWENWYTSREKLTGDRQTQ